MGGSACGAQFCLAELAADADVEYFEDYGSVGAVEARINSITNVVNEQYEQDVEITHVITGIIVRTAEPDPYTATNPNTLLNQFTNHWQANHQGIGYDIAGLFTGKNLQGGTIGVAFLGAVCSSSIGRMELRARRENTPSTIRSKRCSSDRMPIVA